MKTRIELILGNKRVSEKELLAFICDNAIVHNDFSVSYDGYFKDEGYTETKDHVFFRIEFPNGNARMEHADLVDQDFLLNLLERNRYLMLGADKTKLSKRELQLSNSEWRLKTIDRILEALNNDLNYEEVLAKIDLEIEEYKHIFVIDQFYDDLHFMKEVFSQFAWSERERVGFLRMYLLGYLQGMENATKNPPNIF